MESVYLGFFSSIFKAIYNAILQPIVDFLGGILNKVLTWVFDYILKPLLVNVLFPLFKGLIEMIYEIIAGLLYEILAEILKVVDSVQVIFNVFAGLEPVEYNSKRYYMLDLLFSNKQVQKGMWIILAIAFVLMLAFAITAVLKSMADISGELKNPVSKVLRMTATGFLKLFMIPLVCVLLIRLSGVILQSVNTGMNSVMTGSTAEGKGNSQTTLGRTIFCLTTLDAAKNDTYNTSKNPQTAGLFDSLRAPYYYSDYNGSGGSKDFTDHNVVEKDFKYGKMNFVIGFGAGILFLYIMASCSFKFINRMFNVILLYIMAPFFACTMPVDEGKNYDSWKNMFVGQLFSGYGSVVAMQIYLMLVPAIMSGEITFLANSTEGDLVVRTVFLIGGGFALLSAGNVVTGLISSEAAALEQQQEQAFLGATAFAFSAAKALGGAALGLFSGGKGGDDVKGGADGKGGAEGKGGEGKEGEGKDAKGGKDGSSKFNGEKGGKSNTGAGAKFDGAGGKKGEAGGGVKDSAKKMAEGKKSGAGAGPAAKPAAKGAIPEGDTDQGDTAGAAGGKKKKKKGKVTQRFLGGLFVKGVDAQGKSHWGLNLGKHFNFGMKEDGTVGGNVFGVSWHKGDNGESKTSLFGMASWNRRADGQLDKVSVPFMRFKADDDGKMHVSKIKISEGLQIRRTEEVSRDEDGNIIGRKMGGMYCSDLSAIGMKRRYDAETGKVETESMLGTHYKREVNEETGEVEYVKSHRNFLGRVSVYDRDNEGNYHTVATEGWVTSETYALNKETGETSLLSSKLNSGASLYGNNKESFSGAEINENDADNPDKLETKTYTSSDGKEYNYATTGHKKNNKNDDNNE